MTPAPAPEASLVKCGRVRVAGPSLVVEDDDTGMQGWIPPEDVEKVLLGDAARIYRLTDEGPLPAGHLVETPSGKSMSILMDGCRYLAISSQVRTAIKYRHQAALFADTVQRRYNRKITKEAGTAGALLIRA